MARLERGFFSLADCPDRYEVDLESFIHLIYEKDGSRRLIKVTSDDNEARAALLRGQEVINHQPVSILFLVLKGVNPAECIDDGTWSNVVGPSMKAVGDRYGNDAHQSAMWDGVPPDLPAPFAYKRLQLLTADYLAEDITTIVELTEIVMAIKNGREPDRSLFREKSVGLSWSKDLGGDAERLQICMQHNLELQDKYFSLRDAATDIAQQRFAQRMCDRLESEQRELLISVARTTP
ncbi:MAG: hypothetical protein HLUCCX14_07330 [Marinobacter excellens HL-55]|uniref:Uncharacterized protein n=1 Tax=Marinobacter excellens HL-55 TaxID=1305731 RepID=A0A0P8B650_9GAMM|nr:MAG: hypothetical protein HLUCCX14_07330 [Marinobacter excellens HL-55]